MVLEKEEESTTRTFAPMPPPPPPPLPEDQQRHALSERTEAVERSDSILSSSTSSSHEDESKQQSQDRTPSFTYMQEASMEASALMTMSSMSSSTAVTTATATAIETVLSEPTSPALTRIHASGRAGRRRQSRQDGEAILVKLVNADDKEEIEEEEEVVSRAVSISPAKKILSPTDGIATESKVSANGTAAAAEALPLKPLTKEEDVDKAEKSNKKPEEEPGVRIHPFILRQEVQQVLPQKSASNVLREFNLLPPSLNALGSNSNARGEQQQEDNNSSSVLLLHRLFEGFCRPPVDLETVRVMWNDTAAPADDPTGTATGGHDPTETLSKSGSAAQQQPQLVIGCNPKNCKVVALLTAGYLNSKSSTSSGGSSRPPVLVDGTAGAQQHPELILPNTTQAPALFQLPVRFSLTFLKLLIQLLTGGGDDTTENDEEENDKHLLYCSARFQCHSDWKKINDNNNNNDIREEEEERPALTVLWTLCQQSATSPSRIVLQPLLARLLGLLCRAGTTPRILHCLLHEAATTSTTKQQACFVRALLTATKTSMVDHDTAVHDFFCLESSSNNNNSNTDSDSEGSSNSSHGLHRTLTGRQWPFRNDFCMATSFRAECFQCPSNNNAATSASSARRFSSSRASTTNDNSFTTVIVLMTCRSSNGAGFEVRLVPPSPQQNCAVIQVCVYDAVPQQHSHHEHHYEKQKPDRTLTVRQCVLLPRVWYHLAVRHNRSRLKGVFSLSTRQQVSVMLNGKVLMTESCAFPKMEDDYSASPAAAVAVLSKQLVGVGGMSGGGISGSISSSSTKSSNLVNMTITVGDNFDAQIGPVYVFCDNISDASLRALYEAGRNARSKMLLLKRSTTLSSNAADDGKWDSHKSNIVKKSRLLDVSITNDDAEEIVLSQRNNKNSSSKTISASVIDAVADSDEDVDVPLQKANFGSKIFLAWDPKRAVHNEWVVEIHIGAHIQLVDHAFTWSANNRAQDVISSIGGIQALVPVFRAVLSDSSSSNSEQPLYEEAMSDLFILLKSFVQDRNDNARELLRCGGIDVIEQLIYSSRKGTLFRTIQSQVRLSRLLVQSLLELRSACSHYVGLETKVFSRLLFNIPLWLRGGVATVSCANALQVVLLPLLSSLTKANPEKVRDCVGIKDMVLALKVNLEECKINKGTENSYTAESLSDLQQVADVLLGMIFEVLVSGVSPQDLSPFLNFLTLHLESEWIDASQGSACSTIFRQERQRITVSLSTALLFLLQVRPPVPGLFESFAHCCGGVQGGVAWILSGMVNSYDDQVRSLGVRCVAAVLEVASKSADSPLSVGVTLQTAESDLSPGDGHSLHSSLHTSSVLRLGLIAKGLAAMGPGVRSMVIPPSKLTARIVMKLLWHLLKSHRNRLGSLTRAALLCWICDDGGLVSSSIASAGHLQSHLISESKTAEPGYRFCMEWADNVLAETGNIVGRSFRSPLALGVVLRLLRYLDGDMQDRWLSDLLTLAKASRKSTSMLSSLPEWQPCLFHLISETLEVFNSTRAGSGTDFGEVDEGRVDHSLLNGSANGEEETSPSTMPQNALLSVGQRLDRCLELYSTLLGHLVREGGDKALDAVEKAVSLQRVCVNGHDVIFLVLSGLCADIFDNGTLLEIGSIPAQDWKDIDIEQESLPLKQSARLVTDAILSNGTKGLDMTAAVRSWRSLRHLTEIIVAIVTKSGFGVVDLFDYINQQAYAIDAVSSGLNGIRLPDYRLSGIGSSEYHAFVRAAGGRRSASPRGGDSDSEAEFRREVDRRLCAFVGAQILTILDAFIFPDSLDEALPTSQLHGLALVRNSEPRLGASQGPLVSSAIRLSLVLLALLEPCSVKLLQCASRMRCLLSWALELIRESPSSDGKPKPFEANIAPLDRVVVATVLHCHRALGRCAALQSEIESSSYEKYFESRDAQKKHYRRLLRVALELRDVVYTVYRGRNEVLRSSLSSESFEALRISLEGASSNSKMSKESVIREFLTSQWVAGFQDVETRMDLAIPEQLSMDTVPLNSNQQQSAGLATIQVLSQESVAIISDFEKSLNNCFEEYLEEQRKWAETDAVRDLEYDGDSTMKRLSEKYKNDSSELVKTALLRRNGADNRWRGIQRKATEPWANHSHWMLDKYTDRLGRRTLLVQNRHFSDHTDASYEMMQEMDREKAEKGRRARLLEKELSEVMRRNVEAFTVSEDAGGDNDGTDDDSSVVHASDGESVSSTGVESDGPGGGKVLIEESDHDEEWDKIETEEIKDVDAEGDIDAWAKVFIWSDSESVVARFEHVMILTLQVYVEGKLLLTTNGLYFHQVGDELSIMTKQPIDSSDAAGSDAKDRRWRLARLTEIHGRRFMLRPQALELFFSDSHELFLNFLGGSKERDRFHAKLRNSCKVPMLWSPKSLNPRTIFRKSRLTELWKKRKISNFEYLMALNRMAGRSFNDITQYPVFPWILADYTSGTIDLSDSRVYRDLSKPIGALNSDRLSQLLERYKDLELFGFTEAERFLYGSHYSSPGVILHYMIRQEPFTTMAIELQSGRFDCPDRLFFDIGSSWEGCLTSTSDMKELIPEFFCLPEMFLNTNKFPFGRTQGGRAVDNVGLPPWAKGSAYEFVRIHRFALESEFVSQNLHHWIDLVFGYKQRGPEAEAAHNIFHHLSYEGSVDLDKIADEVDREAAESHIQNFGQTPSQIIVADPHPTRYGVAECWKPLIFDSSVPQRLRSLTPAKQFGNKRSEHANGAVLKIHVLSETVIAVYADMSIGAYRWFPGSKSNRLRMDKLRPMSRHELSTSRAAIKRGSAIPEDKLEHSSRSIGNCCFAFTIGGFAKEELRHKAVLPSGRPGLISSSDKTLAGAETAGLLISCGYWDDSVKVHSTESLRTLASETGGHRGPIRCLAVGQDGGLMVTGGQDGTCRVWVVEHPDMAVALSDGYVQTALGEYNDGDRLLSCCHVLWGHNTPVTCVDLDSDLDAVVSGSQSGLLCVHTVRRGEFIRSFRPPALESGTPAGAVSKLALDTTGNLVVHMKDNGLHAFTVNAVRLCSTDAGEQIYDMKICSGGEMLLTGGTRCQVLIRTVVDLNICAMLDLTRHGPIRCIALTPDDLNPTEQFLFVGSDDGMITIVDEDPLKRQTEASLPLD